MAQIDSKWEQLLKKSQPRNFSAAIVFDILSRLPVKSILRFKSVCRKWYSLFGDSQFIGAHLNRSVEESDRCYLGISDKETGIAFSSRREENFEELCELRFKPPHSCENGIIASANGIVCISISQLAFRFSRRYRKIMVYLYILLWNPATRELRILPKFPGQEKCYNNVEFGACLGFGFDPKNNDYKVFAISRSGDSLKVNVYSLRTDSWTAVAEVDSVTYLQAITVHVNGRIHCLGSSPSRNLIVSFDVSEEKIIDMGVPEFHPNNYPKLQESPASLGKSLIPCHHGHEGGYQIWFMKEYGDSKSWSKRYDFPPHPIYGSLIAPRIFLDNGEIVMQMQCAEMLLYDPKKLGV